MYVYREVYPFDSIILEVRILGARYGCFQHQKKCAKEKKRGEM